MASDVSADVLWSAVGDPTRRALLDALLASEPRSATRLSQQLPVTRQAVAKHLAVLEQVGLVRTHKQGRERLYAVDPDQLTQATAQLQAVGRRWDQRLDRIRRLAEEIHDSRQN